ncbi:MAG: hypothetical protein IKI84_01250 [Clostridia bacterium]|nr:hypothetical protein [Clostridia bacterium]
MADRDAFRVMCNMWGVDTAVEKAKEFGIHVSQGEIDTQRQKDKKALDALKNLLKDENKKR